MSDEGIQREKPYSRAFEQFVGERDDIVGLLGYALFKRMIHEKLSQGRLAPKPEHRNLSETELEVYRNQSETFLRVFAQQSIDDERANIIQGALATAAESIGVEIRRATRFWPSVLVGIVAWFLSLVITVIVALSLPDWVRSLVAHVAPR